MQCCTTCTTHRTPRSAERFHTLPRSRRAAVCSQQVQWPKPKKCFAPHPPPALHPIVYIIKQHMYLDICTHLYKYNMDEYRTLQKGPRPVQNHRPPFFATAPWRLQEASRRPKRPPRRPQEAPEIVQEGPETHKDRSTTPKIVPRRHKRPARRPKRPPKRAPIVKKL